MASTKRTRIGRNMAIIDARAAMPSSAMLTKGLRIPPVPTVSSMADVARQADGSDLGRLGGDLLHPGLGLLVLLAIAALNVYKPRGLTRYGWRKQHEQPTVSRP